MCRLRISFTSISLLRPLALVCGYHLLLSRVYYFLVMFHWILVVARVFLSARPDLLFSCAILNDSVVFYLRWIPPSILVLLPFPKRHLCRDAFVSFLAPSPGSLLWLAFLGILMSMKYHVTNFTNVKVLSSLSHITSIPRLLFAFVGIHIHWFLFFGTAAFFLNIHGTYMVPRSVA